MRVLIVDDHTLVRAGIARLLQGSPDMDVVAEASDAQQAIDLAIIHRPDIILLDLSLPGRSGLDVLQPLQEAVPHARIVIMSMHSDPIQVRSALDRGCAGFVVKEAAPQELELAIRAAAAGQVFLSPQVSSKMIAPLLANARPTGIDALSPRQRQILRKLGRGMSSKEIAVELDISVKTVETHRARMMESLGCRRSNELLLLAAKLDSVLG
ncbi:DNA-binding NarL/FixJ family response regulator [Luteimonas cucumeris]|uniref:DNA-binding NarL/FixJ family response regulator n=1 Tax=Luteimonas cucumeris TaxID=985012 RepID=A0A562L5R7_9GAMM|nr:response regulator transcription factor [Luteimonas cucumeris]TWI02784.1 DNA-binding NarL/FixJ family response regulator [Luteimonas cucumeris]